MSRDHQAGRGREVIAVDWTQAHHERGPRIHGVKEAYDYVERRNSLFQTVVTATISNRELIDGLAEAVKRHFRLSCVAQSLVQRAACSGGKSERFKFADEKATVGQKVYTIAREAMAGVLQLAQGLFAQGRTCDQVLEALMPS